MTGTDRRVLIGVIGPAAATDRERETAQEVGRLIATKGWTLLSGGRNAGVMASANRGAREAGGLTIGLLPDEDGDASPDVEVVIRTGLGSARNNLIALSADVLVACGAGAGTTSEIALGIKAGTPVVLLGVSDHVFEYFRALDAELVGRAEHADDAISMIEGILSPSPGA